MDFSQFMLLDEAAAILRETDVLFEAQATRDQLRYIDPLTRKNWRHVDKWRQLAAVVKQETRKSNTSPDRIWVTFTDLPRLGLPQKIRDGKTTPYGIFAYPATYILKKKDVPHAGERPYMIVFKADQNMAEVGFSSKTHRDRYDKMKPKMSDSLDQSLVVQVEKVRVKLRNSLDKWLHGEKGQKLPKNEIHDIARSMLDRVTTKLKEKAQISVDGGPEAIQALLQNDIPSMFNTDELKKERYDRVANNLKHYIQGLSYGYGYTMKYQNVGDDFSVELTDEFKQWLREDEQGLKEYPTAKDADLDGRKPLEWLVEFDKRSFQGIYGYGASYLREFRQLQNKMATYDLPVLKKILGWLARNIQKGIQSYKEVDWNTVNYPMKPELEMLAGQWGVDAKAAADTARQNSEVKNGRQFLYRATEALAKQAHMNLAGEGKSGHWQSIWAKMLRSIGWDHAVDSVNSGQIHSSEPTQGVFMDPRKVQQLAVIVNKAHTDQGDQSQRPSLKAGEGSWDSEEGQHSRTQGPMKMRRGPLSGGKGNPTKGAYSSYTYLSDPPKLGDKTALQRTLLSLAYRLEQFNFSLPSISNRREDQVTPWLGMLVKLLKTTKKVRDSVAQQPEPEPGYLFSDDDPVAERKGIKPIVKKVDTMFERINATAKELKTRWLAVKGSVNYGQMLDSIIQLTSGAGVETPHFSRPFWKQPHWQTMMNQQQQKPVNQGMTVLMTKNKSGYFINLNNIVSNGDGAYYGPFITNAAAVTACVLLGGKNWKSYWGVPDYFGNPADAGEDLEFKSPTQLSVSASMEEVKSLYDEIRAESESEGYA